MVESTWQTGVRRSWKMEEIAALHDFAIKGLSVREIARQLHRTEGSVDRRLRHERGINWQKDLFLPIKEKTGIRRPWEIEEIAALHDLAIKGLPIWEIAQQLNRPPRSVSSRLQRERMINWQDEFPPLTPPKETSFERMDAKFQDAMVAAGYHRCTVDEPGTEQPKRYVAADFVSASPK
jgi:hypothetical protein